ncbi:sigma factor [Streptomyces sp. NPDC014733]|uniref:sigma factor n=1 Tax=Streptomyces sp. NPDC014733 TaxID=3364885 RepID=UPI0036F71BB6
MRTAHPSTPRADGGRSGGAHPPADADALLRGAMERHRPALLRYAARLTSGDPYRAEDIVQETFLRAWLAADRLDLADEDLHDLRAAEEPHGPGAFRAGGTGCVPPPEIRVPGPRTDHEGDRRCGGHGEGPHPDAGRGRCRADGGRGTPRLGAWLFTVAHNLAVDAHRRERAVPVGTAPAEALARPTGTDLADAVVDRQVITQALCRLSPEHRDALVHVHLLDRSGAEAAQAMGIPRGTVKSRTHYALLAMRRELAAPPRPTVPRPRLRNTTPRTATNAPPPHPADRTTATPPPSPAESAAA